VRFNGYNYDGRLVVTEEFTTAGVMDSLGRPAFQTFYFGPEFRGVHSVGVTPGLPLWSLDNLVFIPEPSAGALTVRLGHPYSVPAPPPLQRLSRLHSHIVRGSRLS